MSGSPGMGAFQCPEVRGPPSLRVVGVCAKIQSIEAGRSLQHGRVGEQNRRRAANRKGKTGIGAGAAVKAAQLSQTNNRRLTR